MTPSEFGDRFSPIVVLIIGVFTTSTAATLVRLGQEEGMSSLLLSAGRLTLATAVLLPIAYYKYWAAVRGLKSRELFWLFISGSFLAVHFLAWISSLEYTSVLASVVLVSTSPLFVAVLSVPLLREKVSRNVAIGIVVTLMGGSLIAWSGDAGEPPTRPAATWGATLAMIGALTLAFYMMIGRRMRATLPVVPYVVLVYGIAAALLLVAVFATGDRILGYSPKAYLWLLGLGLLPQLIGHSTVNYALGYLPAATVGLITRLEPIPSTLLAVMVLRETPKLPAICGGALIVVGVVYPAFRKRE